MAPAAFDFPFRYVIRDAANNNRWTNLGTSSNKGLCRETNYCRYAVTFVENHDTEYRDAGNQQDPIRNNVEAANAYLLTMPGTPCVFLKHWIEYKEPIKQMIYARQLAGIHNQSTSFNQAQNAGSNYYVQRTVGTRGTLMAAMGTTAYEIPSTYVVVLSGTNYRLALSKNTETAWASVPSGEYNEAFDVKLTAVSQTDGARLVYTLDGSEPTASNGTKVNDGATININGTKTLKVGLLINGAVSGVITRNYIIDTSVFEPYEITVYLKDPTVAPNNWSVVNFYTWDTPTNKQFNGNWPGQSITDYKTVNGVKFYYCKYMITGKDYCMNFVFNQGPSNVQTVDVTDVRHSSVFEVTTQTNKYNVSDVTETYLASLEDGNELEGDVNGDGEVNISDISAVIDAILMGSTTNPKCDVNRDGEVNISDISAVIDYILAS